MVRENGRNREICPKKSRKKIKKKISKKQREPVKSARAKKRKRERRRSPGLGTSSPNSANLKLCFERDGWSARDSDDSSLQSTEYTEYMAVSLLDLKTDIYENDNIALGIMGTGLLVLNIPRSTHSLDLMYRIYIQMLTSKIKLAGLDNH